MIGLSHYDPKNNHQYVTLKVVWVFSLFIDLIKWNYNSYIYMKIKANWKWPWHCFNDICTFVSKQSSVGLRHEQCNPKA
jgi:hypothetical protein